MDLVSPVVLRPLARDRPETLVEVDLEPLHASYLIGRCAVSSSSLNIGPKGQPRLSQPSQTERISSSERARSRAVSLMRLRTRAVGSLSIRSSSSAQE